MQRKLMLLKASIALLLVLCLHKASAAPLPYQFQIFISDSSYIPTVTESGSYLTIAFSDATLNSLISGYHVTRFERAYALSRRPYMHQYWLVEVDNISMMTDLLNYNHTVFPWAQIVPPVGLISYPNDYGKAFGGNQGELDLVHMRTAWGVDTGNAGVVIGEIDSYFDMANFDLTGKMARIYPQKTISAFLHPNHGTATAGVIAGRTNNDSLLASACPGCMLDVKQKNGASLADSNLEMSGHGDRILNASYGGCDSSNYSIAQEMAYDEIYENGTMMICSAGNGVDSENCYISASSYYYPASLSHNFSVTAVGYDATPGVTENVKNLHDMRSTDTFHTYTHNDRVDLMAPGYDIHVLTSGSDTSNLNIWTETASGTSFSAPMVAGACGLMLAHNSALSPYQMGYILKRTANRDPFNYSLYPQNIQYNGRLGAGILDAGAAMQFLADPTNDHFTVDTNFATLTIDGVEISTLCPPNVAANGANPHLTTHISGGQETIPINGPRSPLIFAHLTVCIVRTLP